MQVDPQLREFYFTLGGQEVMGCAISGVFAHGHTIYQYTEAGLLGFDPTRPTTGQFFLSQLGKENKPADPPLAINDQEDPPIYGGMILFDRFIPRFRAMGGTRYIGRPITQPIIDQAKNRITQYFENVAFYTSATDPNDRTHLLQLGIIACRDRCSTQFSADTIGPANFSQPFLQDILRLGQDLTGDAESSYYRTGDGYIEQVYTNVVIRAALVAPYRVTLQPLPAWLGYNNTLPYFQPALRVDDPGIIFNKLNNSELGFNEATVFEQFVATHGSKAISGPVISQIFAFENVYRQCYANYCLDYDPARQTVIPAPLGKDYLKIHPPEQAATNTLVLKPGSVILKVMESKPLVKSSERQKINVRLFQSGDQIPIPNLDVELTVVMPDGTQSDYTMPATDAQGATSFILDPILAANGALIPYTVCLYNASSTPICSNETFTIWGNP